MRRSFLFIAMAVAVVVPAIALGAGPTQIQVKDNSFTPQNPPLRGFQTGASFHWQRAASSTGNHNVHQDAGLFSSGNPTTGAINYTVSASAGSYHYYCDTHGSPAGGMTGMVKVRPAFNAAPTGSPFTVIWADSGTTTGQAFDVNYRVGTSGAWKVWKNDTAQRQAVFGQAGSPVAVTPGKTYQFQVRSEKGSDHSKRSDFSPPLSVKP
ncbi:MAG: cupredoxin domain-containing protein [Solirubrobacterales bacterium]